MTETNVGASNTEPELMIRKATIGDMIATMASYVTPAMAALDGALAAAVESGAFPTPQDAIKGVSHLQAVTEWCRSNVESAASVVLCAIYLANGRFMVQESSPSTAVPVAAEEDGS